MTTQQAMEIAQAVLLAVGGGGLIVLALSSWLGAKNTSYTNGLRCASCP